MAWQQRVLAVLIGAGLVLHGLGHAVFPMRGATIKALAEGIASTGGVTGSSLVLGVLGGRASGRPGRPEGQPLRHHK